jgi:hypothetical protein
MSKLKKVTDVKIIDIPFQGSMFMMWILGTLFFGGIGIALFLNIEQLSLMGFILMLVAYFMPAILGFDIASSYNEKFNIPKLKHPRRFPIFFINLLFGLTGVGWLIALLMACRPGKVLATVETYEKIAGNG